MAGRGGNGVAAAEGMPGAGTSPDVRCPLCGNRFREGEGTACAFCHRRAGCGMVACPRCGHEFPRVGERR